MESRGNSVDHRAPSRWSHLSSQADRCSPRPWPLWFGDSPLVSRSKSYAQQGTAEKGPCKENVRKQCKTRKQIKNHYIENSRNTRKTKKNNNYKKYIKISQKQPCLLTSRQNQTKHRVRAANGFASRPSINRSPGSSWPLKRMEPCLGARRSEWELGGFLFVGFLKGTQVFLFFFCGGEMKEDVF